MFYEDRTPQIQCGLSSKLRYGAHLHSHLEIAFLLEGEAVAWINDSECPMQKGDLFISFPNQVHRYDSVGYEKSWVLIFPSEICSEFNQWFENCVPKSNCISFDPDTQKRITDYFEQISALVKNTKSELDYIKTKGVLLLLLTEIFSVLEFTEEKMAEVSLMRQLLTFCSSNYTEELTLERLEKELHINRFYISHLFSKKLKMKFTDYINNLRVAHACRLLRETSMNMTDIVSESGFTTARTFNRSFIKFIGDTPSQYRKKYRNS